MTNVISKPLLREDAIIECEHGGRVILKAKKPYSFVNEKGVDLPLLVAGDLRHAPIEGCTLSHEEGEPCTYVASVLAECTVSMSSDSTIFEGAKLIGVTGALTDNASSLRLIDAGQTSFTFDVDVLDD